MTPTRLQSLRLITVATLISTGTAVYAIELDTGNPDVAIRWDNTVRLNLGYRTQSQDQALLANPNFNDGNYNFAKGSAVAKRLDLLSEVDVVVDKKFGFRVSAAGWADGAYQGLNGNGNPSPNGLDGAGMPTAGAMSPYDRRFAKGPSGEILDAFAFANTDIGGIPVSVRAGKHTVFWGESLGLGGAIHGVSYGQYSLDYWKALATPGAEIKELFRPRNSLTVQAQPSPELSIAGQAFFDWEAIRYPGAGTYLSVGDMLQNGGQTLIAGANQSMLQGGVNQPKKTGDWGLSARWSPSWLDGTAGLYLRRFADIQPQVSVTPAATNLAAGTCGYLGFTPLGGSTCYINPAAASVSQLMNGVVGQYNQNYGRNVDLIGASLSKNIDGVSVGLELSYRRNMPLTSTTVYVLPATLAAMTPGAVSDLNAGAPGARGNTVHGVLNFLGVLGKSALYDTATWSVEGTWNTWTRVTSNAAVFTGGAAYRAGQNGTLDPYTAGNAANIDAATKNALGLGINFTPTWFQVFPGVDLSMPLSWSGGIRGNSAVMSGGNKGAGNYSIGLSADIDSKHTLSLRYVGFYGKVANSANGVATVFNGSLSQLKDRGYITLMFKSTF